MRGHPDIVRSSESKWGDTCRTRSATFLLENVDLGLDTLCGIATANSFAF
jgi:hypothetical protein